MWLLEESSEGSSFGHARKIESRGQPLSNHQSFNDALEDLVEACADYSEATAPGSESGSWGKAMAWQQVTLRFKRAVEEMPVGYLETRGGALGNKGGCPCDDPAPDTSSDPVGRCPQHG